MSATPWLAIDTATEIASVALGAGDSIAAAQSMRGARQHAAQIIPLIQHVLERARMRLEQVAGIVVSDGPGSFTGLRIGWAAAKGLAQERGLPLVAVPSLLGAAHAAARGQTGPVAACYDALRGQIFAAVYAFPKDGVETLVAPSLLTLAALTRIAPVRPTLAVGDGAQRYAAEIESWTGRGPAGLEAVAAVAGSLLALAQIREVTRSLDDVAAAEPVYGRPAEAQVKWEARHGRPLPHTSR